MPVHSLPSKRAFNDGAGAPPASAVLFSRPREPRQRVLIRRSWVRAIDEPAKMIQDALAAAANPNARRVSGACPCSPR